jgi:hypothetical protein
MRGCLAIDKIHVSGRKAACDVPHLVSLSLHRMDGRLWGTVHESCYLANLITKLIREHQAHVHCLRKHRLEGLQKEDDDFKTCRY